MKDISVNIVKQIAESLSIEERDDVVYFTASGHIKDQYRPKVSISVEKLDKICDSNQDDHILVDKLKKELQIL